MRNQRPRRERKSDRLISPDARAEEIRCDMAIAPLDRLARTMDERWGIDRLVELVSPETAEKYGSAMAKLNAAIAAADPEECLKRAQVCMRGLSAMNQEAIDTGHQPNAGEWWEYEIDGWKFAIVKDNCEWPLVKKARPDLAVYSMREIGNLLKGVHAGIISEVKAQFPQAQISEIRKSKLPEDFWAVGDELPEVAE